jgi:nucleoside-diphosphate-sugar epimerase
LNISTGSVYAPTSDVIDTSSKRDPSTVYGLTKHASEILVRSVSVSSDLIAWNLRLFYPYGNDMPKNRYIASVFDRVKNGIPIDINLKQQFVFQPMHVIDLCNSIKCIIDYDYVSKGHVLNLSGREPITLIQMASIFGDVLNKQPCYVFTDKYGGDALVDTKFIESLCSGFGYKSWVNITDGLMEFANANK